MFDTDIDSDADLGAIALTLEQHRQEFPGLSERTYFNYGGQGPLPQAGLEAIIDAYHVLQQQGPFSLQVNQWIGQRTERLRQDLATELDVEPETIALTENVTAGCNIALWGIDWQVGDRILMTDCEHPGAIAIVYEICRRFGVEYDVCPVLETLNGGDPVAAIANALAPQTRLVLVSHLLWNTGQVLPLEEIVRVCHEYGGDRPVQVLVDAAQSVGSLPLNLDTLGADFYAFTGHKWLCGPAGVGGLYIRPDVRDRLQPTFVGWRGLDYDRQGQIRGWKSDSRKYEVATSAYPQYEGLRAALAVHQQWGTTQQRFQAIQHNSAHLWSCLRELDAVRCLKTTPPEAGLVSFQVTSGMPHDRLVQHLEKRGYLLRQILNPDCLRACVHYLTLPSEIERFVEVLQESI